MKDLGIGKRIRKIRKKQNRTMKEVALEIEVPLSTYRDWEYGRKIPAKYVAKISSVLNVSSKDIFGTVDKENELDRAAIVHHLEKALELLSSH